MPKMQSWQDHLSDENVEDPMGVQAMGILAEAAAICLIDQRPEWKENPELIEDILDMETVFKVIEICGGMKLNDENLIRAAQEAQMRALGSS